MSLKEQFEKHDSEFHKFELISKGNRLHPSRVLCGYLKLASLLKHPEKFDLCAEHDIVYLAHESALKPMDDTDVIFLSRCGIMVDSTGCLSQYT